MTLSNGSLHQIRRRPPETLLPRCGVGMAWAAFHAVEVVSSSRFAHKRIGYHAIAQSFNNQTPVLLMITNQLRKETVRTNALLIIGLPNGPAAHFKLSYLVLRKDIKNHETLQAMNRSWFFQSLFPQEPNFRGRRVVTFHNQRDFIFFRHHRYILDIKKDKQSGAKGKKGVAKERVKDARLELVWVSRALLIDPTLLEHLYPRIPEGFLACGFRM
ncbi:hypothetical protein HID58_090665 [Brassica napus]|uniref:Brix domain-containing protein n=1 Tax=Brassica napus TaxID=3708 RepID=A0ABQ7XBG9_BRANA|nr:hypothetical protein HID58_090665 [Brassica napus]